MPAVSAIPLRAGPVVLSFEPGTASLRYLTFDGHEVLRRVYAAVRDHNWNTVEGSVTMVRQDVGVDAFSLEFDVRHAQGDLSFAWRGTLEGATDGTIRFTFDGKASSSFRRNRIGFCVLHPAALAGSPCRVEQVDGSEVHGTFPLLIAPHQPFKEIRAIRHDPLPGVSVEVRMDGDTFEMEDQRNWTDASYKTYCTPLGDPFPVPIEAGTRIRQEVTVRLHLMGQRPELRERWKGAWDAAEPIDVVVGSDAVATVPAIGIGLGAGTDFFDPNTLARLSELGPAHLRLDLRLDAVLDDAALQRRIERATDHARATGAELEVGLYLGADAEARLEQVAQVATDAGAPVVRWLVFHVAEKVTRSRWLAAANERLTPQRSSAATVPALQAPVVTGTDFYFTELNRERPHIVPEAGGLCYSINPQVHASDDASLMETLSTQATTLRTAASFAEGLPLIVSPVTLRPRSNPNATEASATRADASEGGADPRHDPRQALPFCAAWTLGSIKSMADGGAKSVTYFEVTGGGGVMPVDARSTAVYPVYHVLADLAGLAGRTVLRSSSSQPLEVEVLACETEGSTLVWLANLTGEVRAVHLTLAPAATGTLKVRVLDETTLDLATSDPAAFRALDGDLVEPHGENVPLTLQPWAVVCVDAWRNAR